MSWLEDLIQSFEKAEQDEGRPELGENDIAEGPSDGLYAGDNLDPDRTPLSPSEDTPAVGTPPGEVWPGDDRGGGGEEPGAGWKALRQQYQAAGLGAGGTAAREPRHAWLDDVNWEDLPLLRQLARAHGAPRGSRGFDGEPNPSPEAWLDKVTPTDLLFLQVLASARRLAALNERRDDGVPSPLFAPPPARIGPAEMTPSLDVRRELKAFRALHPNEFAERGESGGGASRTSSTFGGRGVQRPVTGLEQRIDPNLLEWVRWRLQQGPPPEGLSLLQQLWNSWDALVDLATGRTRPAAPTHVPPPTWTPTPTATGTPTATRTPTATPTVRRTPAPTPNEDELDKATRIIMAEVGTGKDFVTRDDQQLKEMVQAVAWTMRNRREAGLPLVNDRGTPYRGNPMDSYERVFNSYNVYSHLEDLPKVKDQYKEWVKDVFDADPRTDPTHGATYITNYQLYDAFRRGGMTQTPVLHWDWKTTGNQDAGVYVFGEQPGTPTTTPTPTPTATPSRRPTPTRTPSRTPTRRRTPHAANTPSR